MNTRTIAATIVFAAIAVVLNPAFTGLAIPAPFFLFVTYYFWEIPIVAAAYLISPKHGILIAVVNMIIMLAMGQGVAIQQPFYQSTAAISMLLGIFLATKIVVRKDPQEENISQRKLIIYSTALGIIFRVGIMTVLGYVLFRFPVIGFSLPERIILIMLPPIALYDATLPLYTIPIGYIIAKTVRKNLKIGSIT